GPATKPTLVGPHGAHGVAPFPPRPLGRRPPAARFAPASPVAGPRDDNLTSMRHDQANGGDIQSRGSGVPPAFSIGIGLTNECNLRCPHCYRSDMVREQLTRGDVDRVCAAVPAVSMNLGVGQNGLHPECPAIADDLAGRGIKTSITSNGLSIGRLDDARLRRLHSVEVSLDFPSEREHDAFRGPGNWRTVLATVERCAALNVRVTVTAV